MLPNNPSRGKSRQLTCHLPDALGKGGLADGTGRKFRRLAGRERRIFIADPFADLGSVR